MLKPYSKFQNFMLKGLKVILTFTYHYSLVPGECFSSLVQAVTSQAENYKHLRFERGGGQRITLSCSCFSIDQSFLNIYRHIRHQIKAEYYN